MPLLIYFFMNGNPRLPPAYIIHVQCRTVEGNPGIIFPGKNFIEICCKNVCVKWNFPKS